MTNGTAHHHGVIVGTGGLGAGVASQLLAAGHRVSAVGRTRDVPWNFSMRIAGRLEQWQVPALSGASDPDPLVIFVCVRANDLGEACRAICDWAPPRAAVLVLSNGYFARELLPFVARRPDLIWRPGMTSMAVTRIAPGEYEWRNASPLLLWGALRVEDPQAPGESEQALVGQLNEARWRTRIHDDVRRKWIFNTALNSLCGAYQLSRNGQARQFSTELRALFDEAWQLATDIDGPSSEDPVQVWDQLLALIDATARNENSMARDVRLRQKTESEFLAGRAVGRYDFPNLKRLHAVLCL